MEQDALQLQIINDENQGCSRAEGLDALKSPRPDVLLEMIYDNLYCSSCFICYDYLDEADGCSDFGAIGIAIRS